MSDTIQTSHPDPSKQGTKIEQTKYDMIRNSVIETLKRNGSMTYTELADLIEDKLQGDFDGSVT